jgi:hypothetical protein
MDILAKVRAFIDRRRPRPLREWFFVTFDDATVRLRVEPPGEPAWSDAFAWDTVTRVCFAAEDLAVSDGIYVFTSQRPESYAIPAEASGGSELWNEIVRRGLFDAELAIVAMGSTEGLFCWPPVNGKGSPV